MHWTVDWTIIQYLTDFNSLPLRMNVNHMKIVKCKLLTAHKYVRTSYIYF